MAEQKKPEKAKWPISERAADIDRGSSNTPVAPWAKSFPSKIAGRKA